MNRGMHVKITALFFVFFVAVGTYSLVPQEALESVDAPSFKIIRKMIIEGNKHATADSIRSALPFREGAPFDPAKSAEGINNVYALGYFKQITLAQELVSATEINLIVIVEEKYLLESSEFIGNSSLKRKKLREKLLLEKREMVDEEDLELFNKILKEFYRDEGFYFASIRSELIKNPSNPSKVTLRITIDEGPQSHITRIMFKGNSIFSDQKLRTIIISRERWLLSLVDGSGRYNPEMFEVDKRLIERFYQNEGYLLAKVIDSQAIFSEDKKEIHLVFTIEEGRQFIVRSISAPGDDIFLEEKLLPYILVEKGKPYSISKAIQSTDALKELWGEKGFINADVYPQSTPDAASGEVDVTFYVDRGNKVHVNRIEITGNENTKDKLIRRQIDLEEGDLITSKKLDSSKDSVERLSLFKRGGVNWKMHRIDDETADLEMNVQEAKTGQLNLRGSLGSEDNSNKRAFKITMDLEKRNFMGEGIDVGGQASLQIAKKGSQFFEFHVFDPYLFDSDVSGRIGLYRQKQEYTEWKNVTKTPAVTQWGGVINFGFEIPAINKNFVVGVEVGFEDLVSNKPHARGGSRKERESFQTLIDHRFKSGFLQWIGLNFVLDTRNHMVYPSRGYKIIQNNKISLPGINNTYSYVKSEFETSYYTPLIGEDLLVLALRAKIGTVQPLVGGQDIPYNELFNMGGQSTVRGFAFGSIGPSWKNQDPLGSKNALLINAELIFPLLPDYQMKGHVFYDAGAGWETPKNGISKSDLIKRNNFNLRHAVGFGLNLINPQPMKIDWGYKLDRDKKTGEPGHEFHLQANIAF